MAMTPAVMTATQVRGGRAVSPRTDLRIGAGVGVRAQTAKAPCACGGGCPRCASSAAVSPPADRAEQEADRVATQVMRSDRNGLDARRPGPRVLAPVHGSAVAASGLLHGSAGQGLAPSLRSDMEQRLGRDLSAVRIHTDAAAQRAAHDVQARAFTVGNDIAFAEGLYQPQSHVGRTLLAHELVHVIQQDGVPRQVQRSLAVDPDPPTASADPLSRRPPADFRLMAFREADHLVSALCDGFHVNSGGEVAFGGTGDCDASAASGSKPVGCCCLCALTAATAGDWTLHFTAIGGPRTQHSPSRAGGDFFLHPRPPDSDFDFGAWDVSGNRATLDPVGIAGHELCGHGALLERGLHAADVDRVDTNVHDSTVRIENAIHAEQGLPGNERALAAGPHRGESFARLTLSGYAFNSASIPAAERPKIDLAKAFINANNTWVDIFGHSDLVGSDPAKLEVSRQRALGVQIALTSGAGRVGNAISKDFSETGGSGQGNLTVSGPRFTRVEGRSDFDAIPGAPPEALRRVEIFMPSRPAGAEVPNAGTPSNVDPVGPASLSTFLARRFGRDDCDRRLATAAWF